MFSLPAFPRRAAALAGTTGMMLLAIVAVPAQAAEKDELATAMRQLDQVRAALDRARTASFRPRLMTGVISSTTRAHRLTFRPCRRVLTVISRRPVPSPETAVP